MVSCMKYLMFLLLVGCAHGEAVFHGDVTFTPVERATIEHSNEWMAQKVHQQPYGIVWDAPHAHECTHEYQIIRGGLASGNDRDGYWSDKCMYLDPTSFHPGPAAAHEFGHTWGLKHIAAPGMMNKFVSSELEWSEADQIMCEAERVCL